MKERTHGNSKVAKNKRKMVLYFLKELRRYHTLQRDKKHSNLTFGENPEKGQP